MLKIFSCFLDYYNYLLLSPPEDNSLCNNSTSPHQDNSLCNISISSHQDNSLCINSISSEQNNKSYNKASSSHHNSIISKNHSSQLQQDIISSINTSSSHHIDNSSINTSSSQQADYNCISPSHRNSISSINTSSSHQHSKTISSSNHHSILSKYLHSYGKKGDKTRDQLLRNNVNTHSLISSHKLFIDVIKLHFSSTNGITKQIIINILKQNFTVQNIKKQKHKRAEIFELDNQFKIVIYDYCIKTTNGYRMGIFVRIFQPDLTIITKLENIFSQLYNISEIEYTLDLYSDDLIKLYNILSHTICQKKSGKTFNKTFKTTQYCCDIRKAKMRGLKLYLKDKSATIPGYIPRVRIESTVKSSFFNKINKRDIIHAAQLSPSLIFDYLQFKIFHLPKHLSLLGGKKTFKRNTYQSIDSYIKGSARLCEKKFFDVLYGNQNCGGVVAVKKNSFFVSNNIDKTLDTHPIEYTIKNLIKNKSFV